MNREDDEEETARLAEFGLSSTAKEAPQGVPQPLEAIRAAAGVSVKPSATIPEGTPDALDTLDAAWNRLTEEFSLLSDDSELLLLFSGSGSSKRGWLLLQDTVKRNLPSRILSATGRHEYIAMSVDGTRMCAITIEEDDYWVILHRFPERHESDRE